MKIERAIFLDIDGVLATDEGQNIKKKFWFDERAYPFNEKCVKVLNTILKITYSEIVLSSSWRLYYDLTDLEKLFRFNNVVKNPIAATMELGDRNKEIATFLNENEIDNFIILDDMQLDCFPDKFIRTQSKIGLVKEHIELAYKILIPDDII